MQSLICLFRVDVVLCMCLWLSWLPYGVNTLDCVMVDQCSCEYDDGTGTLDLSLIGKQGSPLIADAAASDGFIYSYNPCYPFTEGTCTNAAACQFDPSVSVYYNIGDATKVNFTYDGLNVVASYLSVDVGRTSIVSFICDPSADTPYSITYGESTPGRYLFSVASADVCIGGSHISRVNPAVRVTVFSTGAVICLICFLSLTAYCIVGAALQRFVRGKSGSDIIPNHTFWRDTFTLIKDGFLFTCSLCGYRGAYSRKK